MKLHFPIQSLSFLLLAASGIDGYLTNNPSAATTGWTRNSKSRVPSSLHVSIGIGPDDKEVQEKGLVAGVDYEIPDHEKYRMSRRTKMDEQCDAWYGKLLGDEKGILGSLADNAREILMTPVPLVNDVRKEILLVIHLSHTRLISVISC